MTPTPDAVRQARNRGAQAGEARPPAGPNPYRLEHVAPWQWPADEQARAALERDRRDQMMLAKVWQQARLRAIGARQS